MMEEYTAYKNNWKAIQSARLKSGAEEDSFVYAHIRESDDTPFYVGIGSFANRPWLLNHNSRTKFHKNVVKKHGVRVEIIADSLTWEQACFWETQWIKALRDTGYPLVNQTDGGDGAKGLKHTDETKKILGEKSSTYLNSLGDNHPSKRLEVRKKIAKSREIYVGVNSPLYGVPKTQEHKNKISKSLSGPNHPNYGKPCAAALAALKENHPKYWLGKSGNSHCRYGKNQSEQTKTKLRDINLGKKHSDESIAKMRIANAGNKNGMYGKTHTEEVRDKLRKHFRKLLDAEVLEILNSKEKITKLMSDYKVCRKTIYNIKRGIAYNDVYVYWLSIKKDS